MLENTGLNNDVLENVTVHFAVEDLYTVFFSANGGMGTMGEETGISGSYILPSCGFDAPTGKNFQSWEIDGQMYQPGDEYSITKDTTILAVWIHGHSLTATAAKAATCEVDGNIAYWVCSDCGKLFSDKDGENEITQADTVTKALGHDWGEWTVTTPATEDTEGVETRTCARDASHMETRLISKVPASLKASVSETVLTWSATLPNNCETVTVFAVWYDAKGKMLGVKCNTITASGFTGNQTIFVDSGAATYKLFLLDKNYSPIMKCWSDN